MKAYFIGISNDMCQSSYPNEPTAHFCTPNDIDLILQYDNTAQSIKTELHNLPTWVNLHVFVGVNANITMNNNCHNLGYNTGHIGRGTIVTLFFDQSPSPGEGLPFVDRINYNFNQACGTSHPVLCCTGN